MKYLICIKKVLTSVNVASVVECYRLDELDIYDKLDYLEYYKTKSFITSDRIRLFTNKCNVITRPYLFISDGTIRNCFKVIG